MSTERSREFSRLLSGNKEAGTETVARLPVQETPSGRHPIVLDPSHPSTKLLIQEYDAKL